MCHISEIHGIKDFNSIRIGLEICAEFSLGEWLCTRYKIIQNRTRKKQNHASYRMRDQKYYHRITN